jgi:uncharacterized YigZ family protein
MSDSYLTIATTAEAEIEVRRSRFLAHLERADDEAAALTVVEAARKRHWDARHHCSAFIIGPDGATARASDDGEPAGTAGAPMLEVLRGHDLYDVVAVVTRWFGGTLLGTGGLIRAYSEALRQAVAAAGVRERRHVQRVSVAMGHAQAGRLENELRARGVIVAEVVYAAVATLVLDVTTHQRAGLDELVAQLTGGQAHVVDQAWRWSDVTPSGTHTPGGTP